MEQKHDTYTKPPLGVKPRRISDWERLQELEKALPDMRRRSESTNTRLSNRGRTRSWTFANAEYGKHDN